MGKNIDFKVLIEKFLTDRIFELLNELRNEKKYARMESDLDALFNIVEEKNPDLDSIIGEIDEIQLDKSIYELTHIYKKGLMEGAKVLEALEHLNLKFVEENEDN